MANPFKKKIPTFVAGEPGFAAKLNELAAALRETQELIVEITEEEIVEDEKPKAAPRGRKTAAAK